MLLNRILPPRRRPRPQPGHPQSQESHQKKSFYEEVGGTGGERNEENDSKDEEVEEEESIEDIFSTTLSLLFPDDVRNQHGNPGSRIVYRCSSAFSSFLSRGSWSTHLSKRDHLASQALNSGSGIESENLESGTDDGVNGGNGGYGNAEEKEEEREKEIELELADPGGEDDRLLFAHYLWNAAILLAVFIEEDAIHRRRVEQRGIEGSGRRGDEEHEHNEEYGSRRKEEDGLRREKGRWSVAGERILELGAGTGLCGIISTLAGAEEVTITDYPSPLLLSTLRRNVSRNLPPKYLLLNPHSKNHNGDSPESNEEKKVRVDVRSHLWGDLSQESKETETVEKRNQDGKNDDDDWIKTQRGYYTRIIATDCLWLSSQHENLIRSMLWFLYDPPSSSTSIPSSTSTVSSLSQSASEISSVYSGGNRASPNKATSGCLSNTNNSEKCDEVGMEETAEREEEKLKIEEEREKERKGEVWITAGFHTGRNKVVDFLNTLNTITLETSSSSFTTSTTTTVPHSHSHSHPDSRQDTTPPVAARDQQGKERHARYLKVKRIFEMDINYQTRVWQEYREDEGIEERKKWVVFIVLVSSSSSY